MGKDSGNEMERIQKGLEEFLQQEMSGYREDQGKAGSGSTPPKKEVNIIGSAPADRQSGNREVTMIWGEERTPDSHHQTQESRERRNTKRETTDSIQRDSESRKSRKKKQEKDKNSEKKGKKKKKSGFKKFLFFVLLAAVLLGGLWYYMVGRIYSRMVYRESPQLAGEAFKEEGVVNILLIGSDSRSQGEDGRSDAMILLSVSGKTKTIHMTSLLRDMYVEIPGHDGNRLNAAYAFGGPELLAETVKKNLGIEVNRYVLVNFQAFANLVDAVGGIELELTGEEVKWVNAYLNEYNLLQGNPIDTDYLDTSLSGMLHLNGPQALAYSRNRYMGTDFGRTQRQRNVLSAVIKKLPTAVLFNPRELIDGLFPNLTTNLTKTECLRLGLMAGKLLTHEIVQASIPIEGSYKSSSIRGMSVLEVDYAKNREYIRTHIYGDGAETASAGAASAGSASKE